MNPLLTDRFQIPFEAISAAHVEPGITEALERAQGELDAIIAFDGVRTFENTLVPLDDLIERLGRAFSIVSHLNSVMNSPELRRAYNAVLPRYSAFFARLATNEGLWSAVRDYAASEDAAGLRGTRRRHLDKTVREFIRAGADLPDAAKARVEAIKVELSRLGTRFAENTLDATNAFELVLDDEADLAGLPQSAREQARASARAKGIEGWRFTLQVPSYLPFMQYSERRELRRLMHQAFVNRASGGEVNNRPVIDEILALRRELSTLLGYRNFADYQLEPRMVRSGEAALAFERELREKTLPYWQEEVRDLTRFAREELGLAELEPWDIYFVSERLRKARFSLDAEELRPYFPLDRVLEGMFEIARRLFGIRVTPRDNPHVWHPDVDYFEIHDEAGTHLGSFYADWFPRESKRAGAWMNSFITGRPDGDGFTPHLGLMNANFTPPSEDRPALLTHDEVQTTFHEFGHLLHHCLSRVEVPARAGTSVAWDFVELPSQILENWTWEREALDLFAHHYRTGERLPDVLFERLARSRTFLEANTQMRQLSLGTVDLTLHIDYEPAAGEDVIAFSQEIMKRFSIRPQFANNSFLTSFSHVFAGGYAAGYYSYKWSEVLDADAFTRFRDEGIFNPRTGRDFVEAILSRGDSADPEVLFREFMGRDPDLGALLDRNLGPREPVTVGD